MKNIEADGDNTVMELPSGPLKNEREIQQILGTDPMKMNISGTIDTIFLFSVRDVPVFPEYLREELRAKAISAVKAGANLMRARGEKVTQERVDELLVTTLHREGLALCKNEEDAVHLLVSESPRIGDEVEAEGKPAKVVRRYLIFDPDGAIRLAVESQLLPPAPQDTIVKEVFAVANSSEPTPDISEDERNKLKAQYNQAEIMQATPAERPVAFNQQDVERILHEELLGTEMPKEQTPEEGTETRGRMEEAMFEKFHGEGPKSDGP